MANPLQPIIVKCLETKYNAYVINVVSSSKSGDMDLIACIKGLFYGFEIKWRSDRPSELQKQKINKCIDSGGRAYFIRSLDQLIDTLDNDIEPTKYELKHKITL